MAKSELYFHLLTAGGMNIVNHSVSGKPKGFVFRVDGLGIGNKAICTNCKKINKYKNDTVDFYDLKQNKKIPTSVESAECSDLKEKQVDVNANLKLNAPPGYDKSWYPEQKIFIYDPVKLP